MTEIQNIKREDFKKKGLEILKIEICASRRFSKVVSKPLERNLCEYLFDIRYLIFGTCNLRFVPMVSGKLLGYCPSDLWRSEEC